MFLVFSNIKAFKFFNHDPYKKDILFHHPISQQFPSPGELNSDIFLLVHSIALLLSSSVFNTDHDPLDRFHDVLMAPRILKAPLSLMDHNAHDTEQAIKHTQSISCLFSCPLL